MAILRKQRRRQYTVIDNDVFKDGELSNKALGLLCRMLSLPDNWEFSVEGLANMSSDGRDTVASQLKELEACGYLVRKQIRSHGKMAGVEYIISEYKMADAPYSENPKPVEPCSETTALSNTNISINNKSNTKDIDIYRELPQELKSALMDFEKMRKSIKKPITSNRARKILLNRLDELAKGDIDLKIKLIENAIFHNWQSIYPLDEKERRNNGVRNDFRAGNRERGGVADADGRSEAGTRDYIKGRFPLWQSVQEEE